LLAALAATAPVIAPAPARKLRLLVMVGNASVGAGRQ